MDCALTGLRGGDRRGRGGAGARQLPRRQRGRARHAARVPCRRHDCPSRTRLCSDSSSSRSKNKNNRRRGAVHGCSSSSRATRRRRGVPRLPAGSPALPPPLPPPTTAARIPRVIWMYWAQGEGDESMTAIGSASRLARSERRRSNGEEEVEGRGWEVRLSTTSPQALGGPRGAALGRGDPRRRQAPPAPRRPAPRLPPGSLRRRVGRRLGERAILFLTCLLACLLVSALVVTYSLTHSLTFRCCPSRRSTPGSTRRPSATARGASSRMPSPTQRSPSTCR